MIRRGGTSKLKRQVLVQEKKKFETILWHPKENEEYKEENGVRTPSCRESKGSKH